MSNQERPIMDAAHQVVSLYPSELEAYYADRRLMWRNVFWILVGNFGGATCLGGLGPLMTLRLNALGVGEKGLGLITSANLWAVSFLVMYFSWKSDHTVSRWGRRLPYLLLALPFLIGTVVLFPFISNKWLLIGIMLVNLFFLDMKNSTYPLLSYDCVPRDMLARVGGLITVVGVTTNFFALRYGMKLADWNEKSPYLVTAVVLAITTLLAVFKIKEPPIQNPTTERFRPLSALKVGWRDPRMIVLMTAVSVIQAFFVMYSNWIWLYAKNVVELSRAQSGAAISWSSWVVAALAFPIGWIIDRWGSYKALVGYWVVSAVGLWATLHMTNGNQLMWTGILVSLLGPCYGACSVLVVKRAPPADIGSVTASTSFIRNFLTGSLIFVSGWLIERTGSYGVAFKLGFGLTTIGMFLLFFYRRLMQGPLDSYQTMPKEVPAVDQT